MLRCQPVHQCMGLPSERQLDEITRYPNLPHPYGWCSRFLGQPNWHHRDQNMGICRVLGYSMVLNSAPWVQMGKTPASALTMRLQTILHQWFIVDVDVALRIHCHAPCKRKPKRLLNILVSIIQSWILRGSISGKSMRTRDCNQIASRKATAYSCRPFLGLMLRSSCPAIFITATATVWTCPQKNTGKAKNCMANRSHDILSKEKIGCCSKVVQDNLRVNVIGISDCIRVIGQLGIPKQSCGTRTGDNETDDYWWLLCKCSTPFLHRRSACSSEELSSKILLKGCEKSSRRNPTLPNEHTSSLPTSPQSAEQITKQSMNQSIRQLHTTHWFALGSGLPVVSHSVVNTQFSEHLGPQSWSVHCAQRSKVSLDCNKGQSRTMCWARPWHDMSLSLGLRQLLPCFTKITKPLIRLASIHFAIPKIPKHEAGNHADAGSRICFAVVGSWVQPASCD
jgi:hypothetical protein